MASFSVTNAFAFAHANQVCRLLLDRLLLKGRGILFRLLLMDLQRSVCSCCLFLFHAMCLFLTFFCINAFLVALIYECKWSIQSDFVCVVIVTCFLSYSCYFFLFGLLWYAVFNVSFMCCVGKNVLCPLLMLPCWLWPFCAVLAHTMNYRDAMAICRVYGPPDLFVTFTCNTRWREIADALRYEPGQQPCDQSDLIVRVFNVKVDEFIDDIKEGGTFGAVHAGEI